MHLSPEFIQTIKNTIGADGEAWLASFPDLVAEASHRWDLTDITPVQNLSYNFVAVATKSPSPLVRLPQADGNTVLKLGVPNNELHSEIAALRYFDGTSTCHLLDADPEKGMMLLERLQPGTMLSMLEDDERATRIAADVVTRLWRSVPEHRDDFIQLKDWFDGFKRLRKRYNGGTGELPKRLVETAESLSQELLTENKEEVLMHGDFHHYNVLESGRGWLAIDPKGVVGPRGYAVGPLLINPIDRFLSGSRPKFQTEKRISILSEMLDIERERIRNWGFCHAVLSAWWSLEDKEDWQYAIRCAEIIMNA